MNDTLRISLNGGNGRMTIYLPEYFPCSIKKIQFLDKKCIRSDPWNNDRDSILKIIQLYLKKRIEENAQEDVHKIKRLIKNLETINEMMEEGKV